MCGIVGAIAKHDVSAMLLEGLQRLEYRGYDSAGMALINGDSIQRLRRLGDIHGHHDKRHDAVNNNQPKQ